MVNVSVWMMDIEKINNLEDFITKVNYVYSSWEGQDATPFIWFRGQANQAWDLVPGMYRNGGMNEYEREMVRDFKLNALTYMSNIPENDVDWLFVMQHYGMTTRLLDWTESYLTALYFAVLDYLTESDSAVWILDSWSLNSMVLGETVSVPTSNHRIMKRYHIPTNEDSVVRQVEAQWPIAVRPQRNTKRIIAQKGCFTIHASDSRGLNVIINDVNAIRKPNGQWNNVNLVKFIIDGASKIDILKDLIKAGLSHSVLFPELEGLSKEISFRYSCQMLGKGAHFHNGF
ncbi:MAG: FRG domain-containing protein [Carboxylicivirga sp.]|jgi:hypothetical protein|nr:FRG domain-containing protein [Carboxylicivirga sp.]